MRRIQNSAAREVAPMQDDLHELVSLMIYRWFHQQFPVWKASTDAPHLRKSQSLLSAAIPAAPRGPKGMVHFKHVLDPLWSARHLASLKENAFPWILVVMSPFENCEELDPALQTLSGTSNRLAIWRPARPTPKEIAELCSARPAGWDQRFTATPAVAPVEPLSPACGGILNALYVECGSLLIRRISHPVARELGDLSLQQYLSAWLTFLAPADIPGTSKASCNKEDQAAVHWAMELTSRSGTEDLSPGSAASEVRAWALSTLESLPHLVTDGVQLPEPFMTKRFFEEFRPFDRKRDRLESILQKNRDGEISFVRAMSEVAQVFDQNEVNLGRWLALAQEVPQFTSWLPAFESCHEYLLGAFPTSNHELEVARGELLSLAAEPARLVRAGERRQFERRFNYFKRGYTDHYCSAHEDTVHFIGDRKKMESRVDAVALRNLELLSDLTLADKSYLNRVRAIGKWLHERQCDLPVREILSERPRCCCNFMPGGSRHIEQSIAQMNDAIRQGIDYFRMMLRKCRMQIIQELKVLKIDEDHSRQIAALMSRSPMMELKPRSIDILNAVIQKHADAFEAASGRRQGGW